MEDVITLSSDDECLLVSPKRAKLTEHDKEVRIGSDVIMFFEDKNPSKSEPENVIIEKMQLNLKELLKNGDPIPHNSKNGETSAEVDTPDAAGSEPNGAPSPKNLLLVQQLPDADGGKKFCVSLAGKDAGVESDDSFVFHISADNDIIVPEPAGDATLQSALNEFLDVCRASVRGSRFEARLVGKFDRLRGRFEKCAHLAEDDGFKQLLADATGRARLKAPEAVLCFAHVHAYLSSRAGLPAIEIADEATRLKVRKLEKLKAKLIKQIRKLDDAEVDLDDEENSIYLQVDRYSKQLVTVQNKLEQLLKLPEKKQKVAFNISAYRELNKSLNKLHANNKFPSYGDVERCVRKASSRHGLELTETEIKSESKDCFKNLGQKLQLVRKRELYDAHNALIVNSKDPAKSDEGLCKVLNENKSAGAKRMQDVFERFVKKQESNEEADISTEPGSSSKSSSSESE